MTTNSYSFAFPTLQVLPSADGQTDVVKRLYWVLSGTDGVNTVQIAASTDLPAPTGTTGFVPFAQLTEAQLEAWVGQYTDITALHATIDAQLAAQAGVQIMTLPTASS